MSVFKFQDVCTTLCIIEPEVERGSHGHVIVLTVLSGSVMVGWYITPLPLLPLERAFFLKRDLFI